MLPAEKHVCHAQSDLGRKFSGRQQRCKLHNVCLGYVDDTYMLTAIVMIVVTMVMMTTTMPIMKVVVGMVVEVATRAMLSFLRPPNETLLWEILGLNGAMTGQTFLYVANQQEMRKAKFLRA